jgi:thymidine kinase
MLLRLSLVSTIVIVKPVLLRIPVLQCQPELLNSGMEIHQYVSHHNEYDVVAVDEAFMIPGASWVLIDLFKKGKTIVVSSLDLSATGKAFDEVEAMFPWATHIEKCPAVCTICGQDAYYTHKKVEDIAEITVGGAELYEPRCWKHHSCTLIH